MARVHTIAFNETDCIGDSYEPINNSLDNLDTAVQQISSGSITVASNNFTIGNSLTVGNNLTASTIVVRQELYTRPAYATGGTISTITVQGVSYRVHQFTTVGTATLNITQPGLVEYLVVGGGGGGGADMGGGGGGGGVLFGNYFFPVTTNTTVVVGSGGLGAPAGNSGVRGQNGGLSRFIDFIAFGGGAGGCSDEGGTRPGVDGASGGGASGYGDPRAFGGRGIPGQGFDGGVAMFNYYSGGGGGAGGPGYSRIPNGGPGIINNILGTAYFWGGGGGGSGYSGDGGDGGAGGGGGGAVGTTRGGLGLNNGSAGGGGSRNSQTNTPGGNAGANTGGGGGGGSHWFTNNNGGNGGSGIVIVRYRI